jgi:hypothetical protein
VSDGSPVQNDGRLPRSRETHGRGWLLWWDAAFLLSAVVIGTIRFLILKRGGAPPTIDAGNWLALADSMLGKAVRSPSIVYPPVVPLLTKAAVSLFGLTNGVALLAALSATAPAAGVYIALRWLEAPALLPALLVLGASSVGEATAWGGFPQLIGLGLTPMVLVLVDRFMRSWRWGDGLALGMTLMALLATSHFVGIIALIGVVAVAILTVAQRAWPPLPWKIRVARLGVIALPSVWLIPLYWRLATAGHSGAALSASPNRLGWSNLLGGIEFLYRDSPWVWRVLLPLAILAPVAVWRERRTPLWRVTVALVAATAVGAVVFREERFLYVLTLATALGLACWMAAGARLLPAGRSAASGWWGRERLVAAAVVAVLVGAVGFQFVRSTRFFEGQRNYYGILTPGLVEGIEFLRDETSPGEVVAVTSLRDAPLGWWVEAIAERPTIYGSPLASLVFDDEVRRASLANQLFAPPFPTIPKLEQAAGEGIELILLPTAWVFYDAGAVTALASEAPGAVVRLNSDAVIIRPGAAVLEAAG